MSEILDKLAKTFPQMEEKRPYPNTSGLEAAGRAVLVKPYAVEVKSGGLIELPQQVKSTMEVLEQRAIVIHVGENAWHDEPHPRAKPGDHVLVTRYAGFMVGAGLSADGQDYRLVTDRDIFARIKGD